MKVWRILFIISCLQFIVPNISFAHQTPTTNILLDVSRKTVGVELQIPISELELSFGHNISQNPEHILKNYEAQLKEYLLAHIHTYKNKQEPWRIEFTSMQITKSIQQVSGQTQWELLVNLKLLPNKNDDTRNFVLDYDVVMHQVVNHTALVSIRNDWENGLNDGNVEVGIIARDISQNVIYPFQINLKKGNSWKGFKSMFWLGIEHIKNGTDHLLFIITLLLPACLLTSKKVWTTYAGFKNSLLKLLKIITAFTIGHSATLIVGSLNIIKIPTQIVEITIAFSILISAIHAIKPLFYNKEIFIATGFGFIHGLAFSQILQTLQLTKTDLAISLIGFNLGIEAMQVLIILVTIPWFILMSKTAYFKPIKNILATFVSLAAIGWIIQRIINKPNFLTNATDKLFLFSPWLILGIATLAVTLFFIDKKMKNQKIN